MISEGQIIHVAMPSAWRSSNETYTSDSLASDGFIHSCTPDQVAGVLARHFAGHRALLLLVISPPDLVSAVRVEEAPPHGWYPHIYGPINQAAVVNVLPIEAGPDGVFILPEGFH